MLKRIFETIFAAFFAAYLTAMVFVFSSSEACQTTNCPRYQDRANETNTGQQEEQQPYATIAIIFWHWMTHDAAGFFTLWLVIVGGGQLVMFLFQLKYIKNSLIHTETSAGAAKSSADSVLIVERPYIFMTAPKIVAGPNKSYRLEYVLTNYGRTPAILRFYACQTYIKDEPKRPIHRTMWNGWEVLRPRDSHQGKLFQIRQKLEVNKHPLFWIEVFYLDMFNDVHTSGFTFFYKEDISGKGEFVAIASEKYNYHRTEKMAKGEWSPKIGEPPAD
jgi:hypothetical protein